MFGLSILLGPGLVAWCQILNRKSLVFFLNNMIPAWLQRDTRAALVGTFASAMGAFAVLPLTNELINKQTDLARTRADAIEAAVNPKTASKLGRAIPRTLFHAGLRSLTTLGVANVVLQRMKDEPSQAKRGFVAGVSAGLSQAILTTPISHSLFRMLVEKQGLALRSVVRHRRLWGRMYGIALVKNTVDQGLALMFAYSTKQYILEEKWLNPGPAHSFVSGVSGAVLASLFSMPLVNAESNTLVYPWRRLRQWQKTVAAQKDFRLYWRGGVLRTTRVMVSLGVGLAVKDAVEESFSA